MDGIDAAEEWLDSWAEQANAQAARSVELSRRVAALNGTAEGRDGSIRVTVGSAGQVEQLDLDDRIHDLSGPRLADEIMAVIRRAQAAMASRVTEEVQATVGADTETGRAVIHAFDTRFPADEPREDR